MSSSPPDAAESTAAADESSSAIVRTGSAEMQESPPRRKTGWFVERLREHRAAAPSFEDTTPEEYHNVRLLVLAEKVERVCQALYEAEASDREAMHAEYKDATYWLKWEHRQRQKDVRQAMENDCIEGAKQLGYDQDSARVQLYEAAEKDYAAAYDLQEHRRKERIARQHAELKDAVLSKAESDTQYAQSLDFADQRELVHREETRARREIEAEEDDIARTELWAAGILGARVVSLEVREARSRARLVALEAWQRDLQVQVLQRASVVFNAESFYRGKLVDYEEPRRRDAIEQKERREREFAAWQARARTTASTWSGEEIGGSRVLVSGGTSPLMVKSRPTAKEDTASNATTVVEGSSDAPPASVV